MNRPTRRGLLGGAAVLAAAPVALAAGAVQTSGIHPDADLIALAERFIEHEQAMQEWPCDARPGTPENLAQEANQRQMCGVQRALTLQLGDQRATTAEGITARARCLAVHNSHGAFAMDEPDSTAGLLLHYVMRDAATLGGVSAGVVQPPPSPDADLLEACAAFDDLERAYIAAGGNHDPGSPEEDAAEAERARISDEQEPLVDRICDLRAVTMEGHSARARSLALWDGELMKPQKDTGGWLTQAIVRDLLAAEAET